MQTLIDVSALFAEPQAAAESWIQIMKTGEWDHPELGKLKITPSDLAKFKENFDNRVRGVDLFVDISHKPEDGAVATFKELKVDGDKLMAQVGWTEEGADLIKSGKYRYFSPEFKFAWKDSEDGQTYKDVLFGGALTNRPFLKGMEPVELSEPSDTDTVIWWAEDDSYDPDDDGDDDATADPTKNPDWEDDVKKGILPWSKLSKDQQDGLTAKGFTQEHAAKANKRAKVMMAEDDGVTNAHKTAPKGKPQDRGAYADPDHFKYPIDTPGHIQSAMGYFNVAGNKTKGGYNDEQWSAMGSKIVAAANKQFGSGHSLKNGKILTPSTKMDDDTRLNPNDGSQQVHPIVDDDAGKFTEPKGGKGMDENTVSLAEFQAAQAKITLLETQARHNKFSEMVKSYMFDETAKVARILPAQKDATISFMETLNDEQVAKFDELVKGLPGSVEFGEAGMSIGQQPVDEKTKADAIVKLAEKTAQEQGISFKEAYARVGREMGVE